jgi:hypothetical protein
MTWTYGALKPADAALALEDPSEAAAALNAQTRPVTVDVSLSDVRAVLWPTLEYSALVLLSELRDFSTVPKQVVQLAITAVSLLNSGRTIAAVDGAAWQALLGGLAVLQTPTPISQTSIDAIAGLRTVVRPEWEPPIDAGAVQTARSQP